jgi:hypothetical protein
MLVVYVNCCCCCRERAVFASKSYSIHDQYKSSKYRLELAGRSVCVSLVSGKIKILQIKWKCQSRELIGNRFRVESNGNGVL